MPDRCPVCGHRVIKPEGEVMSYCTNAACPAQLQRRLEHFVTRGAMDIKGIGESLISRMRAAGLAKDVADLYRVKKEDLLQLERMGDKSAENILRSIEKSRERPFENVIFALGIMHVGEEVAGLLAARFGSMEKLETATEQELMTVPGIGPKIAGSIAGFFRDPNNLAIVRRLREAGVRMQPSRPSATEGQPLAGKEFVITGRLETMTRQEAEEKLKALGGIPKDSVTRKTAYLVVGADPGSKLAQAQKLGTPQLSEDEFLKLVAKAEKA